VDRQQYGLRLVRLVGEAIRSWQVVKLSFVQPGLETFLRKSLTLRCSNQGAFA
jgi:hypothetical protein